MNELILHCDTTTEGCVSNDFFGHSMELVTWNYLELCSLQFEELKFITPERKIQIAKCVNISFCGIARK